MPFVDDDPVVEALLTGGAHPPFRVSIGVWGANWCVDHFDVLRSKDLIEDSGELGITTMKQIAKGWRLLF